MSQNAVLTQGTVLARGVFPNPGSVLRPGQYAKVRAVNIRNGALLVPQRAVHDVQGVHQVAVVRPSAGVLRQARTGVGVDHQHPPGALVDQRHLVVSGQHPRTLALP